MICRSPVVSYRQATSATGAGPALLVLFTCFVICFQRWFVYLVSCALAAADDVITSRLSFDVMTKRSGNIVNLRSTKCLPSFPPFTFLDPTHPPSVDSSSTFVLTQTVDNPRNLRLPCFHRCYTHARIVVAGGNSSLLNSSKNRRVHMY